MGFDGAVLALRSRRNDANGGKSVEVLKQHSGCRATVDEHPSLHILLERVTGEVCACNERANSVNHRNFRMDPAVDERRWLMLPRKYLCRGHARANCAGRINSQRPTVASRSFEEYTQTYTVYCDVTDWYQWNADHTESYYIGTDINYCWLVPYNGGH